MILTGGFVEGGRIAAALLGRTELSAPTKQNKTRVKRDVGGRRPLRSVTAHAAGRSALTPPHKGNGFPRQCEHWLGMTRAGRRGRRPLRDGKGMRAKGTAKTPSLALSLQLTARGRSAL